MVAYAENQDYVLVLKNIFYNLKMSVKNSFENISRDIKKIAIDLFPKVLKLIGERKIQDKKVFENYYENIISMCVLLYRNTIVSIFCNFDNKEMFFDFFKKNLEIIKIGAMQKLCEITE